MSGPDMMNVPLLFACAALLALERVCYAWAWFHTRSFRAFCAAGPMSSIGEPPEVLERLFYGFKLLQVSVFIVWCLVHGDGQLWPIHSPPAAVALGALVLTIGQTLNLLVFSRLGRSGVFYGCRFGRNVPWVEEFPFSLIKHPQYVGAVLSIWGLFLILRFPADDWAVLPLVQTVYYVIGAHCES